jgi:Cu+-exporting ATPase
MALPVQVVCGSRFYLGAWNQIKVGTSSMDTLVALGSTTAFGFSLYILLGNGSGHVYFMESAAIITFISVGHWLEAIASSKATASLRALLELAPPQAVLLKQNGMEAVVDATRLRVGDRVLIRAGSRIPADGVVINGASAVDESMLTGEALPVAKQAGAPLYGGTINGTGRLVMRTARTGQETALAQIIQAVQQAQGSRAGIQRLADRVSNIFVPLVVLVAAGTALFWGLAYDMAIGWHSWLLHGLGQAHIPSSPAAAAAVHAASVLIVACPCALGLATPAAIMAAANAASKRGILIRDGIALEKSGRISAVVFDKTGTLTLGRPEVTAIIDLRNKQEHGAALIDIAASLARSSSHPLAVAIVAKAAASNPNAGPLPCLEWREIPGAGIEATVVDEARDLKCRLGSLEWLHTSGVLLPESPSIASEDKAATTVGLARNNTLIGIFHIRDPLKPMASGVVNQLRRSGKQVFMITGDAPAVAAEVAREVGILPENVFAGVRPSEKAKAIAALQARSLRVAFVGDGINDAPALAQADLGIAVAKATDVARESADILLLRSEITAVPEALGLAQATLRTIHQNLFWAFAYNVAAIPLAALGLMSPVVCAIAMGMSDLVVIGNALRLRSWRL